MLPKTNSSVRPLLCLLTIVVLFATPDALASCDPGDTVPVFTSVQVSPIDEEGTFTVSIGYQDAADLVWRWPSDGSLQRAELYLGGRPNPYTITLNAACMTGTPEVKVTLMGDIHTQGCDTVRLIPIDPPEPVTSISNLKVVPAQVGNGSTFTFDYLANYPADRFHKLRVYWAKPDENFNLIYERPDTSGHPTPSSPVTMNFADLAGTILVEGTLCSEVVLAAIEASPPCDDDKCEGVGDPVSLADGNMTFTDTDPLPGTNFFSLRRRYDSIAVLDDKVYRFGRHFRSLLDASLRARTTTEHEYVSVTDENGRQHTFALQAASHVNLDPDSTNRLERDPSGNWIFSNETLARVF